MSKVEPREAFPEEPDPSEPGSPAGRDAAACPSLPVGSPVIGAPVAGAAVVGGPVAPPGAEPRAGAPVRPARPVGVPPDVPADVPAGPGAPSRAGPPGKGRGDGRRSPARRREALVGLAFVGPMLVLFLIFRFGPTLGAAFLSLTDYRLSGEWDFIGAGNYARLLGDDLFWQSLGVTAVYTALYVPMTVLLALGTAVLLHRTLWLRGFFRGLFFLPYVTSIVLAAVIWKWIYEVEDGPLNAVLGALGTGPVDFLGDASLVLPSIAAASAWKGFGYSMLILLAGLQSIPREVAEAATIDGASAWQRFRWVTLPLLRPVLFFVLVIEAIQAFQVFDAMYVMTAGGPVRASYSLVYFLYDSGFKFFDFGYASAIGLVLFLIVLVFSLVQRRLIGREED
ncbi:ABC transporter permease subunit [Streptomyces sp. NPDC016309]|uniref:carbohydrate ABC transporter permease n=1 Tax=Streptomyces sp. NPDC016309 TaxID=3364965 RepID=UPI0036F9F5F3